MTTPRRRKTLAVLAGEHGYATAAVTSWGGFQNQQVFGFQTAYSECWCGRRVGSRRGGSFRS